MDAQQQPHPATRTEPIAAVEQITQPLDTFGRIVFFVIVVEAILMIGLNLYEKSRYNTISQDLSNKKQQLASADYATINTQVNDVLAGQSKLQLVLANKLNWASFYSTLDAVTPKDTRITSISISQTGAYKASGETSSLSSLARAMTAWQQGVANAPTPFSTVVLNNDGYTTDGANRRVSFSISGQVNLGSLGSQ